MNNFDNRIIQILKEAEIEEVEGVEEVEGAETGDELSDRAYLPSNNVIGALDEKSIYLASYQNYMAAKSTYQTQIQNPQEGKKIYEPMIADLNPPSDPKTKESIKWVYLPLLLDLTDDQGNPICVTRVDGDWNVLEREIREPWTIEQILKATEPYVMTKVNQFQGVRKSHISPDDIKQIGRIATLVALKTDKGFTSFGSHLHSTLFRWVDRISRLGSMVPTARDAKVYTDTHSSLDAPAGGGDPEGDELGDSIPTNYRTLDKKDGEAITTDDRASNDPAEIVASAESSKNKRLTLHSLLVKVGRKWSDGKLAALMLAHGLGEKQDYSSETLSRLEALNAERKAEGKDILSIDAPMEKQLASKVAGVDRSRLLEAERDLKAYLQQNPEELAKLQATFSEEVIEVINTIMETIYDDNYEGIVIEHKVGWAEVLVVESFSNLYIKDQKIILMRGI